MVKKKSRIFSQKKKKSKTFYARVCLNKVEPPTKPKYY